MAAVGTAAAGRVPGTTDGSVPSLTLPAPAVIVAAGASLAAGLLHDAAILGHRGDWTAAAVAFTFLGAFQIVWAVWQWSEPRVAGLVLGAAVNAAAFGVWAWSRTTGLPVGHHAGAAEPVGLLDGGCALAEAVVVVAVVVALRRGAGRRGARAATAPLP